MTNIEVQSKKIELKQAESEVMDGSTQKLAPICTIGEKDFTDSRNHSVESRSSMLSTKKKND